MANAAKRSRKTGGTLGVSPQGNGAWPARTPCRDEAVDRGLETLTAERAMRPVAKPASDPSPRLTGLPELGELAGKISWQRSRPLGRPTVGPRRDLWLKRKSARTL